MTPQWFKAVRLEWDHRRPRQRIARYFDCTWQSPWGMERSRVSSLSPTGCYIEDRLTVPTRDAEIQELTIHLPAGTVTVQGTVVEAMPGVGFAVRFVGTDAHARECLTAVVQQHSAMTAKH